MILSIWLSVLSNHNITTIRARVSKKNSVKAKSILNFNARLLDSVFDMSDFMREWLNLKNQFDLKHKQGK
jgi:plasmid maintenance system antidote protein VapI